MVRAGGETVCLIWIQALAPGGPAHCGPPRSHCNFISCHGDNERRVASTHQTPGPPIPTSQHVHARKHCRKTYICAHACVTTETHSLAYFLHSLSLFHTFPQSSHPPPPLQSFPPPPVGLWWAGRAGFLLGLSLPSCFRAAELGKRT